jgi:predicted SAM-dependent methyltransferase
LEHVYEDEAEVIIKGFMDKIKPGGTLHILLPNLDYFVNLYLEQKNKIGEEHLASDQLNFETILTHKKLPTLKFRIMEMLGNYGLKHYRMYNEASADHLFTRMGFERIKLNENCPSYEYGRDTFNNIHLLYRKPINA